jgi:hypothetical protein
MHNQESRILQYAMRDRLRELGWREIEIIDDDLGRSAAGAVTRLEMCRVVDTLLVDQEAVYAPRQGNDRLLLGLKGSLNEYELDLLRQRSLAPRYEKARRGELIVAAPIGYVKTADQRLEKDPDRRVQEAIGLVFGKFSELGSARQTLLWLLEQELQLPTRRAKGDLVWRRPSYSMIHRLLTHPAYGGAYAYGRTSSEPHYDGPLPRRGIRRKPRGEWLALLPGTHEGYVDWPRWEAIRKMITSNQFRAEQPGAAKRGAALLAGLIRCRRCGRRMMVYYTGCNHDVPRYACRRGSLDNGEPRSRSVAVAPTRRLKESFSACSNRQQLKQRWRRTGRRRGAATRPRSRALCRRQGVPTIRRYRPRQSSGGRRIGATLESLSRARLRTGEPN